MKAELSIILNVNEAAFDAFPMSEAVHIMEGAGVMQKYAEVVGEAKNSQTPYTRSFDLRDTDGNIVGQFTLQISEAE